MSHPPTVDELESLSRVSHSDPAGTIYLDYNATTPVLPEVLDAMLPYLREHFGNPSSGHTYGRSALAAVTHARAQVAGLLGCDADEIVFTSGGTEANNLAIRGVCEARAERRHVVTTVIEHPATERPCAWLQRHGWRVTRVGYVARASRPATRPAVSVTTRPAVAPMTQPATRPN